MRGVDGLNLIAEFTFLRNGDSEFMGSRSYNTVVVLFWVGTMSWLMVSKVLPPLQVGEPPSFPSIVSDERFPKPVCWSINSNERVIGWAASKIVQREDNMVELNSYVYLKELPLDHMAPGWLGAIVKPALRRAGQLSMIAKNRMEIDGLNHLVGFESRVQLADIPDAIRIRGRIDGGRLKLTVQSGDFVYKTDRMMPENAMIGDELSPLAQLPGLRIGQTWTMPVYSPFRPLNSPMEILQATVERHDPIVWDGLPVSTKLVVYRSDSGSGLLTSHETRGKLWVRSDAPDGKEGLVLKQEARLFNSTMQFVRLPDQRAERFASALGTDWSLDLPNSQARAMLSRVMGRHH